MKVDEAKCAYVHSDVMKFYVLVLLYSDFFKVQCRGACYEALLVV